MEQGRDQNYANQDGFVSSNQTPSTVEDLRGHEEVVVNADANVEKVTATAQTETQVNA